MTTRRRKKIADFVEETIPSAPAGPSSVRTTPIRVTVDLKPGDHKELKRWCTRAALETDLPGVPLALVFRILGEELRTDPELTRRVQDRLAGVETGRVAPTEVH